MLPQRCGLATFTADLQAAVAMSNATESSVAMTDQPVAGALSSIDPANPAAYDRAASILNASGADLVSLQHEYGIFGGPDGEMVLRLLDRLRMPVVTTLHTVLDAPSRNQRRVMDAIVSRSARVIVMTRRSQQLMQSVHHVSPGKLAVVPHGVPDVSPVSREAGRRSLDAQGRMVLLTFGLLSPGKGIENVIAALPDAVRRYPDLLYVVLGATHPNLVARDGEAYRDGLVALAERLGVTENMRFMNRFVDLPELTAAVAGTDIYLTPYLNEAQSVSGTLAYSYGLGTAVISTPYRHAAELLGDGRGVLVPFNDPGAISRAIVDLLDHPDRLAAMRAAAAAAGQAVTWPRIGARYHAIFAAAAGQAGSAA